MLTTDNFYTSTELYEFLLKNKTDAYGTVRANRRDMPSMSGEKKLKTGEMVAWQKGKMMALRWPDKKDVRLMSTVPNTSTVTVCMKGGKEVMKPQVVIDYNKTMAGVDRVDQAITFYPAMRNSKRSTTRRTSGIFLSNACGMPTFCIEKRVTSLWFIRTSFEKLLNGSL